MENGYLKGLVCGLKAGMLSKADYLNLVPRTLEDLKLHLQPTEYDNFLAHEASPITVYVISDNKLKKKMEVKLYYMKKMNAL